MRDFPIKGCADNVYIHVALDRYPMTVFAIILVG